MPGPSPRPVTHIVYVHPGVPTQDRSNDVGDYLAIDGWVVIEEAAEPIGGGGVFHVLGWTGNGPPIYPPGRRGAA